MVAAIAIRGSREVVLKRVFIGNSKIGIKAENTSLYMENVWTIGCQTGGYFKNSWVLGRSSIFLENDVDVLAEESSVDLIDCIVTRIQRPLSRVTVIHYAVNPYQLQVLAHRISITRDPNEKKKLYKKFLKELLKQSKYVPEYRELLAFILRLYKSELK